MLTYGELDLVVCRLPPAAQGRGQGRRRGRARVRGGGRLERGSKGGVGRGEATGCCRGVGVDEANNMRLQGCLPLSGQPWVAKALSPPRPRPFPRPRLFMVMQSLLMDGGSCTLYTKVNWG